MDLEWLDALHERHRKSLTFRELGKGVVALSRIYVEDREGLEQGKVFDGAAKRAAFACYYAPLHFLFVREVARALGLERTKPRRIVDLGCGLAAAGAALATVVSSSPRVVGYEKNAWAASEARRLLLALGVRGRIYRKPLQSAPAAEAGDLVVAAFSVNELGASDRAKLLARLLEDAGSRISLLVLEPIALRPIPWWGEWSEAFRKLGGRDDAWRFPVDLPALLAALDRASGLDHGVLSGRSLLLQERATGAGRVGARNDPRPARPRRPDPRAQRRGRRRARAGRLGPGDGREGRRRRSGSRSRPESDIDPDFDFDLDTGPENEKNEPLLLKKEPARSLPRGPDGAVL